MKSYRRPLTIACALFLLTTIPAFVFMHFVGQHHRRFEAAQHLHFIILELFIYEDIYGRIPHAIERNDTGETLHSWRFAACRTLFGDMVQYNFYGQEVEFGEPWDSPKNKRYYDGPHRDYGGSPMSFIDPTRPGDFTRFVAITGIDTAFDGQKDVKLSDMPDDLIIIVETRNSTQHWMKPGGDLDVRTMPREINPETSTGISGRDPDGFLVGFADSAVWMLSNDIPFDVLAKLLTISSAKETSRDDLLAQYAIQY